MRYIYDDLCFNISQYPVRRTAQSALHFTRGRPVHSGTNSASPGSIVPMQQLRAKTIQSHFHLCLKPLIQLNQLVSVERPKMPKLRNVSRGDSKPGSFDCESSILSPCCRAPLTLSSDLSNCLMANAKLDRSFT